MKKLYKEYIITLKKRGNVKKIETTNKIHELQYIIKKMIDQIPEEEGMSQYSILINIKYL